MDLGLRGRSILITGASQGIGEGVAKVFAEEGCGDLHLTARSTANLQRVKKEIQASWPVQVDLHPMDLTSQGAPEKLVEAVGDVDVLINNAGVIPGGSLASFSDKSLAGGLERQDLWLHQLTRLAHTTKSRGKGVIINDIGNAGERYDADYIAGTAGNASLMAFTRALGGRSLDDGVRIVGVNPGPAPQTVCISC